MAEGRRRVRERFGVELEPEVQMLGDVALAVGLELVSASSVAGAAAALPRTGVGAARSGARRACATPARAAVRARARSLALVVALVLLSPAGSGCATPRSSPSRTSR